MEIDLSSPCNLSSEGLQQLKHHSPWSAWELSAAPEEQPMDSIADLSI